MDSKGSLKHLQRKKYLFIIAATLSPIISFMLFVYLTSYRPVVSSLENIVEKSIDEIKPVRLLQSSIWDAVMAPHDYLIHGSEQEAENWKTMKARVDRALDSAFQQVRLESKRRELVAIKEQWDGSRIRGDQLFVHGKPGVVNKDSAHTMEDFDYNVALIMGQLGRLVNGLEQEIQAEYHRIEVLKFRGLALTSGSILLGLLLGIGGSLWMTKERKRIVGQSLFDELTGIYNRRALDRRIDKMRKLQPEYQPPCFAVLMIDLDKFKPQLSG